MGEDREIKVEGFRKPDENYWRYVFRAENRKQISPFMVFHEPSCTVKEVYYLESLRKEPAGVVILHAWPGEWRTDIFHYTKEIFLVEWLRRDKEKRAASRGYEEITNNEESFMMNFR